MIILDKKYKIIMTPFHHRRFIAVWLCALITGCGGGASDTNIAKAPTADISTQTGGSGTPGNPNPGEPPHTSPPPQNPPPSEVPPVDPPPQGPPLSGVPPVDPPPQNPPPVDPPPIDPPLQQGNTTQRENAKTNGVTTQWFIADADYASRHEIEGYASATSINRGDSIRLYVQTVDPTYTISVYRLGWYGGKGGRLVAGPIRRTAVRQPQQTVDPSTNLVECDWIDPYVLSTAGEATDPTDWASGIYLAKLTGSGGKQSYIIFVVRDDGRDSALLFQSSVTTYAAYNSWGGQDFYPSDSPANKQAYKLSFNRPYQNTQQPSSGKGAGELFSWELQMLRFVEREGFDVTYQTNIDTHVAPGQLLKHRAFLSVGHDEYWTKAMRDAMETARDRGVNLGFFGANAGFWQVRLEPSTNGQPNRTVVGYKYDTPARDPMYQTDPTLSTGLWRDPDINRPEAALIGVQYDYNSVDLDMVISDCSSWICAGTNLRKGSVLPGMLGYEVDHVDASSPAGIKVLASSPYKVCLNDSCTSYETRMSNMTYYTAPSGAGVFATGSMQWTWGLDA
ncbi:MAG: hypothetical protein JWQ21_3728, partial [Herminiimonas sp.]|nr:hypothetical protein [Herminiimonas sp.]